MLISETLERKVLKQKTKAIGTKVKFIKGPLNMKTMKEIFSNQQGVEMSKWQHDMFL